MQNTQGCFGIPKSQIPVRSVIAVSNSNGLGTTNTRVYRYSVVNENLGQSITYFSNGVLGDSWLINDDGVYSMSVTDIYQSTGTMDFGITRNATALSTPILSQPASVILTHTTTPGTVNSHNCYASCSTTRFLRAGDVIRVMTDGTANSSDTLAQFTICRVA